MAPSSLNDYVVSDIIPRRVDNVADMKLELHELYVGVIDSTVGEIRARFSAKNIALLKSLKSLIALQELEASTSLVNDLEP